MSSSIEDIKINNSFQQILEDLKNSQVQILDLSRNNLGAWDEGRIATFVAALAQSQVHTLDLSRNNLGKWDERRIAVFVAGLVRSQVQFLGLSDNNLGNWGEGCIPAFVANLAQSQVRTLDLRWNYLDAWNEGRFRDFIQVIKKHPSLIQIYGFTGEKERTINTVFKERKEEQVSSGIEMVLKNTYFVNDAENIIHQHSIGEDAFKHFQAGPKQLLGKTASASSSGPLLFLQPSLAATRSAEITESAVDVPSNGSRL